MFAFLSNEPNFAQIFLNYFKIQANYHKKMTEIMEVYLPLIDRVIGMCSSYFANYLTN